MAKRDLSKLSDAEYKALSPEELMKYNKTMPEIDYENPYTHREFPKVMYSLVRDEAAGVARLRHTVVANPKAQAELGSDWQDSPAKFGIETAPAAPDRQIDDSYEVPLELAPDPVAVGSLSEARGETPKPKGKGVKFDTAGA
jgi:hypothetical protein